MPDPTGPPGDSSKYAKSYQDGYDAAYRDWQELHKNPRYADPLDERDNRKENLKKKLDLENRRAKKALEKGYDDGWNDAVSDADSGYLPSK